eukprot:gene5020-6119_t
MSFQNHFEERWGYSPPYQTVSCMAAIYMLEGAVRKGGLDESGSLKSEMDNQFQSSFWGVNTADAYGRNIQRTMVTLQLDAQGVAQIISPVSAATSPFVYPIPSWDNQARNKPCEPGKYVQGSNQLCRNAESGAFDFCNDTVCVATEAGAYTSTVGSLTSTDCPINMFAAEPASSACELCPPGSDTGNTTAAKECAPCANGHFQPLPGGNCTQCPIGSFISNSSFPKDRCIECNELPGFYYQPNPGQSECMQCPGNTVKLGGSPGLNQEECVCTKGFWRPDGLPGHACTSCPEGGVCDGGLTIPYTQEGMFAKTKMTDGGKVLAGYPFISQRAGYPDDPPDPNSLEFDLPEIFFECKKDWTCESESECAGGFEGNLCASCTDGYFGLGEFCVKCFGEVTDWVMTILAWIGMIYLWLLIKKVSSSHYTSLRLFMHYMQYVTITQSFGAPWPKALLKITQAFALSNFKVDFYSPSCIIPWSPLASVWITFSLAPLAAFIYGCRYLVAKWVVGVSGLDGEKCMIGAPSAEEGLQTGIGQMLRSGIASTYPYMVTLKDLHTLKNSYKRSVLSLLNVMYAANCMATFNAFRCTRFPDDSYFLKAVPSVECGSLSHVSYIVVACFSLAIYVVGTPVLFLYNLRRIRREDSMHHRESLQVWGGLYVQYETGLWFWELVILSRRLVLCLILVFWAENPHMQLLMAAIAMILYICLQFFHRPFLEDELDVIDCASLLSVLFYILAGLVFLADIDSQHELAVVVALFLTTLLTIGICMKFFAVQYRYLSAQGQSGKLFSNHTACAWAATVLHISHRFSSLEALRVAIDKYQEADGTISYDSLASFLTEHMQTIKTIRGEDGEAMSIDLLHTFMFLVLDADRNGKLMKEEVITGLYISGIDHETWEVWTKYIRDTSGIQVQAVQDVDSTGKVVWHPIKGMWQQSKEAGLHRLKSMVSVVKTQVSIKPLQYRLKRYQLELERNGGQIHRLFTQAQLKHWLARNQKESRGDELIAVALIDQLITPYTNDSSRNGPYSYNKQAKFYRDLVNANPMFLEYVIQASDTQMDAFKTFTLGLQHMQQVKEASGIVITQEIQAERRAPLLDWLVGQSTSIQRGIFHQIICDVLTKDDMQTACTQQNRVHANPSAEPLDEPVHTETWANPRNGKIIQGHSIVVGNKETSRSNSPEENIQSNEQSIPLDECVRVFAE